MHYDMLASEVRKSHQEMWKYVVCEYVCSVYREIFVINHFSLVA